MLLTSHPCRVATHSSSSIPKKHRPIIRFLPSITLPSAHIPIASIPLCPLASPLPLFHCAHQPTPFRFVGYSAYASAVFLIYPSLQASRHLECSTLHPQIFHPSLPPCIQLPGYSAYVSTVFPICPSPQASITSNAPPSTLESFKHLSLLAFCDSVLSQPRWQWDPVVWLMLPWPLSPPSSLDPPDSLVILGSKLEPSLQVWLLTHCISWQIRFPWFWSLVSLAAQPPLALSVGQCLFPVTAGSLYFRSDC